MSIPKIALVAGSVGLAEEIVTDIFNAPGGQVLLHLLHSVTRFLGSKRPPLFQRSLSLFPDLLCVLFFSFFCLRFLSCRFLFPISNEGYQDTLFRSPQLITQRRVQKIMGQAIALRNNLLYCFVRLAQQ